MTHDGDFPPYPVQAGRRYQNRNIMSALGKRIRLGCVTSTRFASLSTTAHSGGYQSIGSFHSDNVELLISQYSVPELPFKYKPNFNLLQLSNNFSLSTEWAFVNHGAFGAALDCGQDLAKQWRDYSEKQPLRYFDRDLLPHLAYSTRQLADFARGHRSAMTLTQNSTFALNTIISGYTRTHSEKAHVIYFDTTYGSVKKMAKHYTIINGHGTSHEIPILKDIRTTFQTHNTNESASDRLVSLVEAKLKEIQAHKKLNLENALLILDHTTSNTAINFPIEKIAAVAKKEGMLVAVDGAHGLLAQDLDLCTLAQAGIDFYISNCHKWFCSPRGAAFLYCENDTLRETILRHPAVISHGIDDGYHSRFIWDGCRDYAAQLSIPVLVQFWQQLGPTHVRRIMRNNLMAAIGLLVDKWYPGTIFDPDRTDDTVAGAMIVPPSLHSPMALIRLPLKQSLVYTSADAKAVQDYLFSKMIECPIKCVEGSLYVRISSHIYNTLEHYEKLGDAIVSYKV